MPEPQISEQWSMLGARLIHLTEKACELQDFEAHASLVQALRALRHLADRHQLSWGRALVQAEAAFMSDLASEAS